MDVHLLVSGELVASLHDDFEGKTPRAVKQKLAAQVGVSRFRQRLFWEDGSEIRNDHVFAAGFVKLQLVKLEYWPFDGEEDRKMMRASNDGDSAALEELLQQPRDPNVTDDSGNMPLHYAARGGHLEPIRLLLEAGADINSKGDAGAMPIHGAAERGHADAVRLLVDLGAQKDQPDNDGVTPALSAASRGHVEIIQFLAEVGANIDHAMDQGGTPLWFAAGHGHLEIVRLLVEAGAKKEQTLTVNGRTPLHMAASCGHLDIVRVLVDAGADCDAITSDGETAGDLALRFGHEDVYLFLTESVATPPPGKVRRLGER
jgi:ankyrin repeat protein